MVKIIREHKKIFIIAAALVTVAATLVVSISSNAAMSVNTYVVDKGALDSEIEVNGNVESDFDKVYYADIDARIGSINIKEGDFVKKGDVIISYDMQDIERLEALADLQAKADLGSYNNAMQSGGRTAGLYSEAKRNLAVLDQQIADTQAAITTTQNALIEKKASLSDFGSKLQISLIDWEDKPDSDEYQNLLKLVQTNAYERTISWKLCGRL